MEREDLCGRVRSTGPYFEERLLNVLSPALTLSRDEIDRIVSILRAAIEDTMAELDREGLEFAA